MNKNARLDEYFDSYVREDGTWDFDTLNSHRAIIDNIDAIVGSTYRQGLSDGQKNIDFVTIATLGNAANFGDLTVGGQHPVGTADSIRGVWLGRQNTSPYSDNEVIDYVNIATQGDAVDFGNLTAGTSMPASASTGHGGL